MFNRKRATSNSVSGPQLELPKRNFLRYLYTDIASIASISKDASKSSCIACSYTSLPCKSSVQWRPFGGRRSGCPALSYHQSSACWASTNQAYAKAWLRKLEWHRARPTRAPSKDKQWVNDGADVQRPFTKPSGIFAWTLPT